jgi:hypothetical protein
MISSSAISGSQASEFHASTDACTGRTVAAGASCAVQIVLAPTATGAATARIAFADNASGSPHTIALSGSGTNQGRLSGHVLDGNQAGDPPVAAAAVYVCLQGTRTRVRDRDRILRDRVLNVALTVEELIEAVEEVGGRSPPVLRIG